MTADVPLSTMLSQALIAFTIEFDDVFEQQMPHSTTTQHGAGLRGGPVWLVSQAMWANYVRFLVDGEMAVAEVRSLARVSAPAIKSRLNHLTWWNYVRVDGKVVRLTPHGRQAADTWRPIAGVVEKRWRSRFGAKAISPLVAALRSVVKHAGLDYPYYLPVVDYKDGLRTSVDAGQEMGVGVDVSALLSQLLIALTLDFERDSPVSLPVAANILRLLDAPVPVKALPLRSGVSKEAMSAGLKDLAKHGLVTIGAQDKAASLTAKGEEARVAAERRLSDVEKAWSKRYPSEFEQVQKALDTLLSPPKLAEGLTPHVGGWRLEKPYIAHTEAYLADPRGALPRHPMVLHRGGFPDGS